jgi:lipopolysaccharide transport system ATP-binding protein
MHKETVIKVEGIGKKYNLGAIDSSLFKAQVAHWMMSSFRLKKKEEAVREAIWALKDVSFDLHRGDAVGIVGKNGAGKSTLLKILSRTTAPTTGRFMIKGKIASLLEVGTGFHPELTGRENVFLNGAIMGMKKHDIKQKFDEIVDFSGVHQFIDTPVKRYSSGMYVRLAFAVAAHLESEIMIIDEVLAVGDSEFQKKCLWKMGEVTRTQGRTVLFVSHNLASVKSLCSQAVYLEKGTCKMTGNVQEVVDAYVGANSAHIEQTDLEFRTDRTGNKKVQFTSFHIEDTSGNEIDTILTGADVVIVMGFKRNDPEAKNVDFGFSIASSEDITLSVTYSSYNRVLFQELPERGYVKFLLKTFNLSQGRYKVNARIVVNNEESDWPQYGIGFIRVEPGDFYQSGHVGFGAPNMLMLRGEWMLAPAKTA